MSNMVRSVTREGTIEVACPHSYSHLLLLLLRLWTLIIAVSAARLLNLLASNGLRHILHYNGLHDANVVEEDEDDYEFGFFGYRRRARRSGGQQFPKVPSEEGEQLMGSGDFGSNPHYVDRLKKRKRALATKIMWRELGVDVSGPQRRDMQSITQVGLILGERDVTGSG